MSQLGRIFFLRWSTRDDRGVHVQLYDLFDHLFAGAHGFSVRSLPITPDVQQLRNLRRGWVYWAFPLIMLTIPVVRMSDKGLNWIDLLLVCVFVLLFLQQLLDRYWSAGVSPTIFRDAMLGALRCPRCAYPLERLDSTEQDGCTICPECGAAWRLPDAPGGAG